MTIDYTSIVLESGCSAAATASDGENIYVTDGRTPFLHRYSACGEFLEKVPTARVYRQLRYDANENRYLALAAGSRVYLLNCRLREVAVIPLEIQNACDGDLVLDAGGSYHGSDIEVTHHKSVSLYRGDGKFEERILRAGNNRMFLRYASFASGSAWTYEQAGRTVLSVGEEEALLPPCVQLKSFLPLADDLYGAFSYHYLYLYILPVYVNHTFDSKIYTQYTLLCNSLTEKCCNSQQGVL